MAVGYSIGPIFQRDAGQRRRALLLLGVGLTLAFILLRAINRYGDPHPWEQQSSPLFTLLSFLNCTKYPPSLLFLLMTLGPAIIALAIFDRPLPAWAHPIVIFGRVPLFYYVLHIFLIHAAAVVCDYFRFGWSPLLGQGPWELAVEKCPPSYGVSLGMVYLIWIVFVVVLYPPCRWFARVKQQRRSAWLSYL
jgi:hypothetical protein